MGRQGGRLLANRTSYDDDTGDGNTERASTAADRSLTYRATTRECGQGLARDPRSVPRPAPGTVLSSGPTVQRAVAPE